VRFKIARPLLLGIALLLISSSFADAELTARGDLFVSFKGGIAPTALPRHRLAPIAINFSGRIGAPPGSHPPPLRQIEIAINRNGHLDTRGLPAVGSDSSKDPAPLRHRPLAARLWSAPAATQPPPPFPKKKPSPLRATFSPSTAEAKGAR
jgi:hypothetical protein